MKIDPVKYGTDALIYVRLLLLIQTRQKLLHLLQPCQVRFYAEIQIIFDTAWAETASL